MKYAGILAVIIYSITLSASWHSEYCGGVQATRYYMTGQIGNPLVLTCEKPVLTPVVGQP